MNYKARPTSVTVIGWVWIIIGSLMCFSAVMGLITLQMFGEITQLYPEDQLDMLPTGVFRFYPVLAAIQIFFSILGIVSGIHFLKLKLWSCNVLEILTWLLLISLIGFMVFWISHWISIAAVENGLSGFSIMGIIMAVVIISIYVIPLGIMLRYLRGNTIRNAML